MGPSSILDITARACSSCGKMIMLRQVRACWHLVDLQTYQKFPVVDCVCMPDCIDDCRLEIEYGISHKCWGVLIVGDYLQQGPDSRLQSPGFSQSWKISSWDHDVKLLSLTCSRISFKVFKTFEEWVWALWEGVWALPLTCAPFVYLNISAKPCMSGMKPETCRCRAWIWTVENGASSGYPRHSTRRERGKRTCRLLFIGRTLASNNEPSY